jgi:predicted RNA binding protein YcfA (HicA-like mRNA interferase family)
MPKLRRLSGKQVIAILEQFGYEVIRTKGSHHRLRLIIGDLTCYTTVPVHSNRPLAAGTLRAIYRQALQCVSEDELQPHFYAD